MWNNIALKLVDIFTYRPQQDKIIFFLIKYEINKIIKKATNKII